MRETCSMVGCTKPLLCRGLCNMHYVRLRKHGSPEWEPPAQLTAYERVMSRVEERPAPYPHLSACWVFLGSLNDHGYGMVAIKMPDGRWRPDRAHRVVAEHHHGPCPEGMRAMHLCDTPACVNPEHLRWGTARENTADMVAKGRARGNSMLSDADVIEIRRRYVPNRRAHLGTGCSAVELAAEFGVRPIWIWHIATGRARKRLQ